MSHIIKKFSILFFAGIIFLSIPHNFAQNIGGSYDVSGFSAIMNDAPCVKLQYDLKPNSRDYYIYGNVMKLQMFLYQNDLMAYPPTGLYGDYTFNAVMNFQKQIGIPATGIVDLYTRMALAKSSCGSSYNPNDFYVSQGYGYGYNSLPQNTIQQNVVVQNNIPNTNNQSQPGNSPFGYQTNTYYTPYVPVPVSQASTIYHCGLNNIDYGNQASYNAGCISSNATNYTVTFVSNGSTLSTQTIASGATAATPTIPTLSGYTFTGWYSDSGFSSLYNFSTAVTYNISLYAKWTAVSPGAPVTPAAVSVSNVSTSSLTLIWLASASSTGYQITGDHGFVSTTTSNLSINLYSLLFGTSYTFGVAAYNSNGTSSPITVSTTTLSTSTSTPTIPIVSTPIFSSITATSVLMNATVTSTGGAAVTDFGFEWGTSTSYSSTWHNTLNSTFSTTSTNLICNTTYHVRSFGMNSAGTGYSADTTFTTGSCSSPTTLLAPNNFTVSSPNSLDEITLTWDAPVGYTVDYYNIYRSSDGVNFSVVNTSITTNYTDTCIDSYENGAVCYYYVTAVDLTGDESFSTDIYRVDMDGSGNQSMPSIFMTNGTLTTSSMSWSSGIYGHGYNITGFNILRNGVQRGTATSTESTYTDNTSVNTEYYYSVVVNTNLIGYHPSSTTTSPFIYIYSPSNFLTSLTSTSTTATSTRLSWTAPATPVAGYDFRITGNNGFSPITTTATSVNLTGLNNSTNYTFTVTARNAWSSSASSINVTTLSFGSPVSSIICPAITPSFPTDQCLNPISTNLYNVSRSSQYPIAGENVYIINSDSSFANYITLLGGDIKTLTNQLTTQIIGSSTYKLYKIGQ